MKAQELMIGDWVLYNGKFVRVNCIASGFVGLERPVLKDVICKDKTIEPIPLTPEILEKNGFKETDVVVVGTRKMRWESEDTRTEITIWMDDTMPMEIRKNIYYEDEVCYTLPCPWAVHQLQHALRLCGIDKEIAI